MRKIEVDIEFLINRDKPYLHLSTEHGARMSHTTRCELVERCALWRPLRSSHAYVSWPPGGYVYGERLTLRTRFINVFRETDHVITVSKGLSADHVECVDLSIYCHFKDCIMKLWRPVNSVVTQMLPTLRIIVLCPSFSLPLRSGDGERKFGCWDTKYSFINDRGHITIFEEPHNC